MATELDQALNSIMDALVQPGQPFETVPYERFGQQLPAFKNAPPSLTHYFAHYCHEHADLPFLVDGDNRLTFGETYAAAQAVAAGLVSRHGVKTGDRVGIAARNSANWIISYMGIVMAGGCATLLNGFWTGDELAFGIRIAECSLVLADKQRAERLEGTDHSAQLVIIGHDGLQSCGLANVWAEPGSAALPEVGPDDLATVLYTSGSTGFPKGAWSDHRGVVSGIFNYVAQSAMASLLLTKQGNPPVGQPCALVAVPLFHVTGEVPLFLQSFAIGRKLVMMPKWDAREAMRLIEAEKVSYFVGVPLMSYEMATHPDRGNYDLSTCKSFAAGGAPRPIDHVTKIRDSFPDGFPLLGYGLTETNAVGCGNFNENYLAKPGSTGRASRPLVDLAILDDDGNKLAQGQVGEVCLRTVANFRGYWKNDAATEAAFTSDGYFRSGDLGYLDEDGYLFIVDRKKDIIIRGGENISCIEVEQALYAHPDVAECSVFGLPDERFGEIVGATYMVREGKTLTPEQLRAFLDGKLAPFKMPAHLWQADEPLPKLGTQKIDKKTLREQYAAAMGAG
ncbi:class I adenylate-forming enzyme family protein [Allopontixanthobacter sp.]|uniref:class I adenylate-forming enzyme family protein n=1 Tax=Allopontixanthobacter sp. TaxID=2906452 RepID=UPI002ABAAE87|nr:class I adenylate-forming enzyme family protein [Allopontixanthobacter sp.]MDZ4308556.1 class I adenylate-forming enzyme family protein [Allopontixanthobacter sp.]